MTQLTISTSPARNALTPRHRRTSLSTNVGLLLLVFSSLGPPCAWGDEAPGHVLLQLHPELAKNLLTQKRYWRAPTYNGVVIGKSTEVDVESIFGIPEWRGPPEEALGINSDFDKEIWLEYRNLEGPSGRMTVVLGEDKIVHAILLYPKALSVKAALAKFGNDYIARRDNLTVCPSADELQNVNGFRIRKSPRFLVYPRKGIFINLGSDRSENVLEIGYLLRCRIDI